MRKKMARENALANWNTALNGFAGVTENATQGDAEKILSAGFDIRSPRTPKPPLEAPTGLQVKTNGSPGVSKRNWEPMPDAKFFLVQKRETSSPDGTWEQAATSTKAQCEVDGAVSGQERWFRVVAVDSNGKGPWSASARRLVM